MTRCLIGLSRETAGWRLLPRALGQRLTTQTMSISTDNSAACLARSDSVGLPSDRGVQTHRVPLDDDPLNCLLTNQLSLPARLVS